MSIITTRDGCRDRQKSLKAPKTCLGKGCRKLSGERALTCEDTNVPPGGTCQGERKR